MKRRSIRSKPLAANPFNDYVVGSRGLARVLRVAPTTATRIAINLNLPFVVVNKRKHFRVSAIQERLLAQEVTLAEVRRKARR